MVDCWNCPKRHELTSLRAAVKRFESDPDYQKLKAHNANETNRRLKAEADIKAVRAERDEWRARAEKAERNQRHKTEAEMKAIRAERDEWKARAEKAERKLEKTFARLKSRDRALEEQKEIIRQRDRQISALKEEKEELLQPFRDALQEMRETRQSSDDEQTPSQDCDQTESQTDPDSIPEEIKELMKTVVDLRETLKAKEAQLRNNSTNCSMPSSQCPNKRTPNNREKSGRKPGGQPGHEGHGREKLKPDVTVKLKVPDEVLKSPDLYYKTAEKKIKQIHSVRIIVEVVQYEAVVYRNRSNGKRVWSRFPKGIVNDITYDASVKALACMLHSHGNMSYEKVQEVISELTDGKLNLSTGFLAGLEREFSDKTVIDRQHIWERMLKYPYMHADGTTIYVNGKQRTILVCTSPAGTLYFYSESKGHKAVQKSVLKDYQGTVISDGESTFFNYGTAHQGCLEHELRYLKGSMETETDLTWAGKMRALLRKAIHTAKEAVKNGEKALPEDVIKEIEDRYDEIIGLAEEEYKTHSGHLKYYNKGCNTMKRLRDHKQYYLHFLHDLSIPATNSRAEQKARPAKMHVKQSGGYRDESGNAAQFYCDALSLLSCTADRGGSRYRMIRSVFAREMPAQRPSAPPMAKAATERKIIKAQ